MTTTWKHHEVSLPPFAYDAVERHDLKFIVVEDHGHSVGHDLTLYRLDPVDGYAMTSIMGGTIRQYLNRRVTYALRGDGVMDGYVALGIEPIPFSAAR